MVTYSKRQVGIVSRVMCSLAQEIIAWSKLHLMTFCEIHSRKEKNILVDQLSHPDQVLPTKWSHLSRVFSVICKVYSHIHVDLLATRANTKLPLYVSPVLDPMVQKQDAFQHHRNTLSTLCIYPCCFSKTDLVEIHTFDRSLLNPGHSYLVLSPGLLCVDTVVLGLLLCLHIPTFNVL